MTNWNVKTVRLKSIAFMVLLSGLSACSTTQKLEESEIQTVNTSEPEVAPTYTAQETYQQALTLNAAAQQNKLIAAQTLALEEQDWLTLQQASDTLSRYFPNERIQARLVSAFAQLQQGQPQLALLETKKLQALLDTPSEYYWHQLVQGSAYSAMQLNTQAIPFLLRAADAAGDASFGNQTVNPILWSSLQSLSLTQLQKLDSGSDIQRGWSQLAQIKQIYLGSPIELHSATNNWRRKFVDHPAAFALDEKVAQLMEVEPFAVKNLGVFLPLTGANRALGDAVKSGIMAALDKHQFENVYFIDANASDDDIRTAVQTHELDFAVGPLLKANINRFEQSGLLEGLASIYLNRVDVERQSSEHFYFALAPEHELDQALAHFMARGFEKPLLLSTADRTGERLTQYFTEQWLRYNKQAPIVGLYKSNEEMESVITELLEVGQSEQRIDAIKRLFKAKVESETRSRRDIDVVYFLADATQTRLLKPYLDVNVSTFVERIPLYASSKSHSTQIDSTDKRDLSGLYFTELPWMLPTSGVANLNNRQLRETVEQLWPNKGDLEQRLFAMGFDAIAIIPELRQLSMLPGKRVSGLTGALSVNTTGEIVRHLLWARYDARKITPVTLEHITPQPLQKEALKSQGTEDVLATEGMAPQSTQGAAL
ncbi:penicillin-binding protein activator [Pseudoalteromonas sp. SSDWG2]|uniref:penicillin-binding protein activator n=1 Tax=Pseudoalteromonas sp. SSDWG2 TaxID=3139391 RepID=UPI003BAA7646